MPGFLFDPQKGETQTELAQRRRLANALLARAASASPRNLGEGLSAFGAAIGGRLRLAGIDAAQRAGDASASQDFGALSSALLGGTPTTGLSEAPLTPATTQDTRALSAALKPDNVPDGLINSESGGNFRAQNNVAGSGGRGHFGRLQFSRARLQEASRALGENITPERFLREPELQVRVEQWHFSDIDNFARQSGIDKQFGQTVGGVRLTPDAFRSMAHLGGKNGAKRFIETGGRHNPADANGVTLRDYGQRFGGAAAQPTQAASAQPTAGLTDVLGQPVGPEHFAFNPAQANVTIDDSIPAPRASQPGAPGLGQAIAQRGIVNSVADQLLSPTEVTVGAPPPIGADRSGPDATQVAAQPPNAVVTPTAGPANIVPSQPAAGLPARARGLRIVDEDFQGVGGPVPSALRNLVTQGGQIRQFGQPQVSNSPTAAQVSPTTSQGLAATAVNAPPQTPAPTGTPRLAAAVGVLNNSFSNPQQRAIATMVVQQELKRLEPPDETKRLRTEKLRIEIDRLRQPRDRKTFKDANGRTRFLDDGSLVVPDLQPDQSFRQPEVGTIPPGFELRTNPETNGLSLQPIPGGPADAKAKAAADKDAQGRQNAVLSNTIVSQDIDRAIEITESATLPTTGLVGNFLKDLPGTAALDLNKILDTIKANTGFDRLQEMRNASQTGGALGQVSEFENRLLQATRGNLEQSQSKEQFLRNLRRLGVISDVIVNGLGTDETGRPIRVDESNVHLLEAMIDGATSQSVNEGPKKRLRFNPETGELE